MQPVIANRSLFTNVFAGDSGFDLYTLAVSDVYQDLFGAGIYVGKGLYDVDAFERSLHNGIPENTLLSHDLCEGIHGRVGLVSDIVLYEDYPPHYLINVRRSHRWVRGDWQLLPWLLMGHRGAQQQRRLALIDRWKMLDNLRRSLLPPGAALPVYRRVDGAARVAATLDPGRVTGPRATPHHRHAYRPAAYGAAGVAPS